MKKTPILLSWSGGKDAAYTLHKLQKDGWYEVRYLLTVFNKDRRVPLHEIPESLIDIQAFHTGIPLLKIYLTSDEDGNYEAEMLQVSERVKKEGIGTVAFSDLFLEDLRHYRERQLRQAGMEAVFPLWQINPDLYWQHFFRSGFEAVICSVNGSMLDTGYCGRHLKLGSGQPGVTVL